VSAVSLANEENVSSVSGATEKKERGGGTARSVSGVSAVGSERSIVSVGNLGMSGDVARGRARRVRLQRGSEGSMLLFPLGEAVVYPDHGNYQPSDDLWIRLSSAYYSLNGPKIRSTFDPRELEAWHLR